MTGDRGSSTLYLILPATRLKVQGVDVDGIDSPDEDGGEDGGGLSETEVTGLGMLISSIDRLHR